jgi:hypothetical protein
MLMHFHRIAIGYREGGRTMTILRRASGTATSTSAVMPGTLPDEWRFALMAAHPTSPLSYCVSL